MGFKKNTATGVLPIGCFVSATTGLEVTTGTAAGTYNRDGTTGALSGTISYNAESATWEISDVTAAEMNGDNIGLKFTLAECLPIHFTIRTEPAKIPVSLAAGDVSGDLPVANSAGVTELLTRVPDATAGEAGGLAIVGSAMTLTAAYDAAKTAAQAGDEMGLAEAAINLVKAGLALESTLTAMKGAGWSDETLAAIKAVIDAIETGGGDATADNQTEILTALDDIKGSGFVKDSNSLVNVTGGETKNITTSGMNLSSR